MRSCLGIVLAFAWLGTSAAMGASERDQAIAIIERAIKSHGGAAVLNKAQNRSRKGEGTIAIGSKTPFKTEETVRFPDRCRMSLDLGRTRLVIVLKGEKGWMQTGGTTQEMDKATLTERREELYVWWLMTLTPLLKSDFELKQMADAKVDNRDASVVQVSRKGHANARLYFDKKSGLLVEIARRGTEAGVPVNKEYLYSDHQEYDGVKMPAKELIKMNGNTLSEVKFTRYQTLGRIEDKTFDKP